MGIAICPVSRANTYSTGEIEPGKYSNIYKVKSPAIAQYAELLLSIHFKKLGLHITYAKGTEFYKKEIEDLIEPLLKDHNIEYTKLTDEEISRMFRIHRYRKLFKKYIVSALRQSVSKRERDRQQMIKSPHFDDNHYLEQSKQPRDYQIEIICNSIEYFKHHDKGILALICGTGKTLISLWTAFRMHAKTIIVGVPSVILTEQWKESILSIFPEFEILIVGGASNTTAKNISDFLKKNKTMCTVITTYASCHKVNGAVRASNFVFDMKINDECHHLTTKTITSSPSNTKKYVEMLNIPSKKQLSLTATRKDLESDDDAIKVNMVGNNNVDYFGEIIDSRNLLWGIQNNIITDYSVSFVKSNEECLSQQVQKFNITCENDKRLWLASFILLKCINVGHPNHALIYCNSIENCKKIVKFIEDMICLGYFKFNDNEIYVSAYDSETKSANKKQVLNSFNLSKIGIIACVYCLGEGYDNPLINITVFAENMSSIIRIVQAACRALRKNKDDPTKKAKIILPILIKDDYLDKTDLQHVKEIIHKLGMEDESIGQKVKVFNIDVKENNKSPLYKSHTKSMCEDRYDFGEYDEELTNQLRIQERQRASFEIGYDRAVSIISSKHIRSKEEYYALCELDNRLPIEPDKTFGGKFKKWIDYLSIPLDPNVYTLESCKERASEFLNKNQEFKKYYLELHIIVDKLCEMDPQFPPNGFWEEYYGIELTQIIVIKFNKIKIRIKPK
jgi:superfamily II DNA or RNA helicase